MENIYNGVYFSVVLKKSTPFQVFFKEHLHPTASELFHLENKNLLRNSSFKQSLRDNDG